MSRGSQSIPYPWKDIFERRGPSIRYSAADSYPNVLREDAERPCPPGPTGITLVCISV
jgi:hypothetical protein